MNLSFYQNLYSQLESLDVAILVNNIGGASGEPIYFKDENVTASYQTIAKNVLSTTFLTQLLIPNLRQRWKRSAIINVSSGLGSMPNVGFATYGGCKAYINQLTQTLKLESQKADEGQIDFLCFSPNLIQSQSVKFKTFVQVPEAVNSAMKALGRRSFTKGHWFHALQTWVYEEVPGVSCLVNKITPKFMKKHIDKLKMKQEDKKIE